MALGGVPNGWVEIPVETMNELRQRATDDAIYRNTPYPPPDRLGAIPVQFRDGHWYIDLGVAQAEDLSRNDIKLFCEQFRLSVPDVKKFNEWQPLPVLDPIDPAVVAAAAKELEIAQEEEERAMLRAQLKHLQEDDDAQVDD